MLSPDQIASQAPGGFLNLSGGNTDPRYCRADGTSYPTAADACTAIPVALRRNCTVVVGDVEMWWLPADTSNTGLIVKTPAAGLNSFIRYGTALNSQQNQNVLYGAPNNGCDITGDNAGYNVIQDGSNNFIRSIGAVSAYNNRIEAGANSFIANGDGNLLRNSYSSKIQDSQDCVVEESSNIEISADCRNVRVEAVSDHLVLSGCQDCQFINCSYLTLSGRSNETYIRNVLQGSSSSAVPFGPFTATGATNETFACPGASIVDSVLVLGATATDNDDPIPVFRTRFTVLSPGTAQAALSFLAGPKKPQLNDKVTFVGYGATTSQAPRLAAPANPQAAALGQTSISVAASSVSDAVGYALEFALTQNGAYTEIYRNTVPTYTHTGRTASTTYYYRWKAVSGSAQYSDSLYSEVASATTQPLENGINTVYLSQSPNVFGNADASKNSSTYGTDSTAGIQALYNNSSIIHVIEDVDFSYTSLVFDTRTRISALPKSGANRNFGGIRRPFSDGPSMRNRNAVGMNQAGTALATIIDSGMNVQGTWRNGNGFHPTTFEPLQNHDAAPTENNDGGWNVVWRFAGLKNSVFSNNTVVNQATFGTFSSNCDNITANDNQYYANDNLAINTDGQKWLACRNIYSNGIKGRTGDDLTSVMGADIFFPQWPLPAAQAGGQVGYDKWAVWGECYNINLGVVDMDGSGLGVRFGSSTIETKVSGVTITELKGGCAKAVLIADNYAESPLNFNAPEGDRSGYFGDITIEKTNAYLTTNQSYKPAAFFFKGNYDSIRFGDITHTNYTASPFPYILLDADSTCETFTVETGVVTPDSDAYISVVAVKGRIETLFMSDFYVDRRGKLCLPQPAIQTRGAGSIGLAVLNQCRADQLNNFVEIFEGSIGEIRNSNMRDTKDDATKGAVYVGPGKVLNKYIANGLAPSGALPWSGEGSVSIQEGDAFSGGGGGGSAGDWNSYTTLVRANGGEISTTVDTAGQQFENTLVAASIFSRFRLLYMFAGGTAASQKYNIITPLDTDEANRISWAGSWVYDQVGAKPDGGAGTRARTHYVPFGLTPEISGARHLAYYSCESISTGRDIGFLKQGGFGDQLHVNYQGTTYYGIGSLNQSLAAGNTKALYVLNKDLANNVTLYRSVPGSAPVAIHGPYAANTDVADQEYHFGNMNVTATDVGADLPSTRKVGFISAGQYFRSLQELTTFCDAVHAFMAAKGFVA